jgi:hypothetical protein
MKRKLSRRNIRNLLIKENISIYKNKSLQEKRKYKARKNILNRINKFHYINENIDSLNEFDMSSLFSGMGGMVNNFLGAGSDSIKQYLIGTVLGSLGIPKSGILYDILENSLENVEFNDLTGLLSGETKKEDLIEDLIQGIVEGFVEYGMGELYEKMKDVPMLGSVVPNKEELLGNISVEGIANEVSDYLTPKLLPVITKMIDGFSLTSLFSGGNPLEASPEEKLKALAEVYQVALNRSKEKINKYNKQIEILDSNIS